MRHHADVGYTHFYIRLEDTDELKPQLEEQARALSKGRKEPVVAYVELGSVNRKGEDNYTDIMTRQQEFVNRMITKAREDGVEWIAHIDDDEVLHPRGGHSSWAQVFQGVKPECASVHLKNWEGFSPELPTGSWLTDPGVRYLPSSCGHLFAAYGNGKSVSRTAPGQQARGVHHFGGGKECELPEEAGIVLHHDSLAMGPNDLPPKKWVEKNALRAGSDMSKVPFQATIDSVEAVKSGDTRRQREVWERYRSQVGARYGQCPNPVALKLPSHKY